MDYEPNGGTRMSGIVSENEWWRNLFKSSIMWLWIIDPLQNSQRIFNFSGNLLKNTTRKLHETQHWNFLKHGSKLPGFCVNAKRNQTGTVAGEKHKLTNSWNPWNKNKEKCKHVWEKNKFFFGYLVMNIGNSHNGEITKSKHCSRFDCIIWELLL